MIYIIVATGIFAFEMLLWWCRATYPSAPRWIPHFSRYLPFDYLASCLFGHARRTLDRQNSDRWVISAREQLRALRKIWLDLNFTDRFGIFLRLLEIGNATFLTYIIFAQTIGAYSVRMPVSSIFKYERFDKW